MNRELFEADIEKALVILRNGGIILYPTDTVWGVGCDATNPAAVARIYQLKNRSDKKSMIILIAEEKDLFKYVAAPDPSVFDFMDGQVRPTTIIFENAVGLADNLVAEDGSIAIRLVKDEFCRHLVKRLQKPLVSTSANISGQSSPASFSEISGSIKTGVDYIVKWRQDEKVEGKPSRIVKWGGGGHYTVIRD